MRDRSRDETPRDRQGRSVRVWDPATRLFHWALVILVAVNIYMGLKTGFGEGGSIVAAILGLVIFRALKARYSILENNITQTAGSAAGSIGNIVNVVPRLA